MSVVRVSTITLVVGGVWTIGGGLMIVVRGS